MLFATHPGIMAAGIFDVLPLRDDRSWLVSVKGRYYEKNRHPESFIRVVTDGYFNAAGIPLLAGRRQSKIHPLYTWPLFKVNAKLRWWFLVSHVGRSNFVP
jgi:hypothetical protein